MSKTGAFWRLCLSKGWGWVLAAQYSLGAQLCAQEFPSEGRSRGSSGLGNFATTRNQAGSSADT